MSNVNGRLMRRVAVVVCACALGFSGNASAQNVGSLSGIVKDAQGLPIPGATLTLLNRVSQATQSALSDERGRYALANIAYGTYVLTISLSGFTTIQQVVEVQSNVPVVRDVT